MAWVTGRTYARCMPQPTLTQALGPIQKAHFTAEKNPTPFCLNQAFGLKLFLILVSVALETSSQAVEKGCQNASCWSMLIRSKNFGGPKQHSLCGIQVASHDLKKKAIWGPYGFL